MFSILILPTKYDLSVTTTNWKTSNLIISNDSSPQLNFLKDQRFIYLQMSLGRLCL